MMWDPDQRTADTLGDRVWTRTGNATGIGVCGELCCCPGTLLERIMSLTLATLAERSEWQDCADSHMQWAKATL